MITFGRLDSQVGQPERPDRNRDMAGASAVACRAAVAVASCPDSGPWEEVVERMVVLALQVRQVRDKARTTSVAAPFDPAAGTAHAPLVAPDVVVPFRRRYLAVDTTYSGHLVHFLDYSRRIPYP